MTVREPSNQHLIEFDDKKHVFHLHNHHISYLFSIETGGFLSHLYFGKRIKTYHGQLKNPKRDRGFSGEPSRFAGSHLLT